MNKILQATHAEKVRAAHRKALRILKNEMQRAQGYELALMQRCEEYHISRLHSLWFSTSRREKQC